MLQIDVRSRVSIYEQIKNQIMELIISGILQPDEQLPSIRALARDLSLNVNTVKRAFSDLEAAGVIYTVSGRGSFVSKNAVGNRQMLQKARDQLQTALRTAKSNGLTKQDVYGLIDDIYKEE